MQSPSGGDAPVSESSVSGPSARPDSEGWPQQPWSAHAPTPAAKNTTARSSATRPFMPERSEAIINKIMTEQSCGTQLFLRKTLTICRGSLDSATGSPLNAHASCASCHIMPSRSAAFVDRRSVSFPCSSRRRTSIRKFLLFIKILYHIRLCASPCFFKHDHLPIVK